MKAFWYGNDICACGHGFGDHFIGGDGCEMCAENGDWYVHKFIQDNLDYIELLAKRKGLV